MVNGTLYIKSRCVAGCPPNSSTGQAQLETAPEITSNITVSLADLYYGGVSSPRFAIYLWYLSWAASSTPELLNSCTLTGCLIMLPVCLVTLSCNIASILTVRSTPCSRAALIAQLIKVNLHNIGQTHWKFVTASVLACLASALTQPMSTRNVMKGQQRDKGQGGGGGGGQKARGLYEVCLYTVCILNPKGAQD